MGIPSLLRLEEHKALASVSLSGRVLDLGGDKNSEYLRFIGGNFETTSVNMSEDARPDIFHDLEKPLPLSDASYDHVLLINVLEHIFEYQALLSEACRVVRPGGSIVIVVPYLFPVHPSPDDFHRLTKTALERALQKAGFADSRITALGSGVFAAQYLLLDRLLPKPLRAVSFFTWRYVVRALDTLLVQIANLLGKHYLPEEYALGYCAVARK